MGIIGSQCIRWTKEEDELFKSWYGKISCEEMVNRNLFPGRTTSALYNRSTRLGLEDGNRRIIHSFDENFWKTPNQINAFWAGNLSADGCMRCPKGGKTYVLSLQISIKDLEHLQRFKEAIKFTGNIGFYNKHCSISTKKDSISTLCYLNVSHAQIWEQDLREIWGIIPRKTYHIQPPALTDNILKLCFYCGYLVGDGTMTADCNRPDITIRFTSCTEHILLWFKDLIDKHFTIRLPCAKPSVVGVAKYGNCYYYTVGGFRAAKIIDVTSRLPIPLMDRKWKNPRILERIEGYKTKYPSFWSFRLPIEDEIDDFLKKNPISSCNPTISATTSPHQSNLDQNLCNPP